VSVKLVRGIGTPRLSRITHLGVEEYGPDDQGDRPDRAAEALKRLLRRLGLGKAQLGRIAVAIGAGEASLREVAIARLEAKELQMALRYEARKHLDLEEMTSPILDAQVLGSAPPEDEGGAERIRVLFAAAPEAQRNFPLSVLSRLGLEPEVIDLEPLAALNELMAHDEVGREPDVAVGLLDIGGAHAALHITARSGGLLTRQIFSRAAGENEGGDPISDAKALAGRIQETFTFYRGRYRKDVQHLFVSGGGALDERRREILGETLHQPVSPLGPSDDLMKSARSYPSDAAAPTAQRFTVACGLCRWWDDQHV
jgi:Tfp pilus assembly PilM family ATPase